MELSADKRDKLIELLSSEYTLPEEYIDCVKVAVKQYATKNYSDETIDNLVRTPQSLSKGLALLRERNGKNDLSLLRGILSEWLVCAEYNALKNKGSVVMTITNPDSSSKADLLHVINTGNGFKAVPGPDVKSGGSTYVFNQWKKIVNNRYEIPMVDIDGILTTESGLKQLTKKQHTELEELYQQYPNKRPVISSWYGNDINRVIADYLKFIEFGTLPSIETSHTIKDINVNEVKSKLYSGEFSNQPTYSWEVFSSESKTILTSNEVIEDSSKLDNPSEAISKSETQDTYQDYIGVEQSVPPRFTESVKLKIGSGLNWAKKAGKGALKWVAEHPKEIIIVVAAIGEVLKATSSSSANTNDEFDSDYDEENYESEIVNDRSDDVNNDVLLDTNLEEHRDIHRSKHIRNLPEGQKASPEKIRTAEENGFLLEDGQTWVDDY
ncbi:hypothetical protein [Streptococcus suis]|uniref:hypothetical protein n=1 Tax=Streptococcus suis TaxID=1307 RepID=UPI003EBF498C